MALQRDTRDRLRFTLKAGARQLCSVYGFLLLSSALFWYLRFAYWSVTYEPAFSDIAGYVATGENIVRHFFFGLNDAHQVYYTPVTPGLIAIAKLIAPGRFEQAFRVLIQVITFAAALGVVREIALLTGRKWLAASFLFIVAICRPSIFWSLKLSTEPVCEALLYATAATALATLRTGSWRWAGLCGGLALCLGLNRPGFLPGTMFIPLAFLIQGFVSGRRQGDERTGQDAPARSFGALARNPRTLLMAGVFALCFFGMWSLWIGRNLVNYGVFMPTAASGAQSSIWEYGGTPVKIGRYDSLTLRDGSEFSNFGKVMEEAGRFSHDYESAQRLFMIARAWHAANWMDLPRVFLWRLKHIVANRGANGLTRVSREAIFLAPTPGFNNPYTPVAWLDLVLLDKTPFICFVALFGLGLFIWTFPLPGLVFAGLALAPWLTSAAVIGYERTVEALIATTIWFAFFGLAQVALLLTERETSRR